MPTGRVRVATLARRLKHRPQARRFRGLVLGVEGAYARVDVAGSTRRKVRVPGHLTPATGDACWVEYHVGTWTMLSITTAGAGSQAMSPQVMAAKTELDRAVPLNAAPNELQAVQDAIAEDAGRTPGDEWSQPATPEEAYRLGEITTRFQRQWESLIPTNMQPPGNTDDPQTWRWWKDLSVPEGIWAPGIDVVAGDELEHDGTMYRALQDHTTQPDWPPDATPALWEPVTDDGGGDDGDDDGGEEPTIPVWAPDLNVTTGEHYTHDGHTYEVVQSHTTQVGWEPPGLPALWKKIT